MGIWVLVWPQQGGLEQPAGKETDPWVCSVWGLPAHIPAVSLPGARELGEFHAFIVSDLRELRGRTGQAILLLRIQNPWGRRCWQGPWREG